MLPDSSSKLPQIFFFFPYLRAMLVGVKLPASCYLLLEKFYCIGFHSLQIQIRKVKLPSVPRRKRAQLSQENGAQESEDDLSLTAASQRIEQLSHTLPSLELPLRPIHASTPQVRIILYNHTIVY